MVQDIIGLVVVEAEVSQAEQVVMEDLAVAEVVDLCQVVLKAQEVVVL